MSSRDIYSLLGETEIDDDQDDDEYEYYIDDDDADQDDDDMDLDEMGDEFFDPDEYNQEDDEEEGEEDEEDDGEGRVVFQVDSDDASGGSPLIQLAALLNAAGTSDAARSSVIARFLSGASQGVSVGTATRSGGVYRLGSASADNRQRQQEARQRQKGWWTPQKEPHPRGAALLKSGEFGSVAGRYRRRGPRPLQKSWAVKKMSTETIPNTNGTVVANYPSIPYVGQYAKEDYSIFFSATQYYTLHLYDVSAQRSNRRPKPSPSSPRTVSMPGSFGAHDAVGMDELEDEGDDGIAWGSWGAAPRGMSNEDTSLKKIKTVQGEEGRWTITDCDSTRDGERMIYSSITPYVHMLRTSEHDADHVCLDFTGARRRGHGYDGWQYDGFGIWSIRFSADGKEVVAGAGSGKILVYDIEREQRSLSIPGHADDVNAVCFADESSTNILVSGSDDGYVKIWDRRSLSGGTPSGVLVGAVEGITYTSPKGDGRYIVVNSKDQAARLYDLRKMRGWEEFKGEPDAVARYGQSRYDYRNSHYPPPARLSHPKDCSVMTFRGHAVLRTLIRCHFSPRESTGQGYIYSGSADGMIHIWSLDGRLVQVLDRSKSIPLHSARGDYSDPSAPEKGAGEDGRPVPLSRAERTRRETLYGRHDYCTRDVSWHGYEPSLMSTSWEIDGNHRRGGSIAKHEWKGLGKGGLRRLEDWVEKEIVEQAA